MTLTSYSCTKALLLFVTFSLSSASWPIECDPLYSKRSVGSEIQQSGGAAKYFTPKMLFIDEFTNTRAFAERMIAQVHKLKEDGQFAPTMGKYPLDQMGDIYIELNSDGIGGLLRDGQILSIQQIDPNGYASVFRRKVENFSIGLDPHQSPFPSDETMFNAFRPKSAFWQLKSPVEGFSY